jgi:acyl-homoserine-lactone acylase
VTRAAAAVARSTAATAAVPAQPESEVARRQRLAHAVTIVRDDWGIAHVTADTDANAVFGMIYAQAEDDFSRVETNFINAQGRLAEAEGEAEIFRDLRMKLYIDPIDLQAKYRASPAWLKRLMAAWADGLNFYLHTHPAVAPRVITRFEPWMALSFSEGSIGGDIERISLAGLEAFYGGSRSAGPLRGRRPPYVEARFVGRDPRSGPAVEPEPTGSNGFAIAPKNSVSGNALLWINPHTSFYFRSEAHVTSGEGLNVYGASTWGQFFVYQGFNERAGWMHTSSGVDNIDEYAETVVRNGEAFSYRYGREERPMTIEKIVVPYKTSDGMARREFTVYRTHHGPIVREADGKWISVRLMDDPVNALIQSYSRTRARSYREYRQSMRLHTNSSNNTVFADADGNVAYFHSNFIPRRDTRFDWSKPVDGSDPATDWRGVFGIDDSPNVVNPPNGWIQNTNNWPFTVAGVHSPRREAFPAYVDTAGENARGVHALRVLEGKSRWTPDTVVAAAFDSYLTEFDVLLPPLLQAWDALPDSDARKAALREPVEQLRGWDRRWSTASIPTSVAVFWGEELGRRVAADALRAGVPTLAFMESRATAEQRLAALSAAVDQLASDFGSWRTPWGNINRFQRISADITPRFDDAAPSIPVGFTSSRWGSLASFGARAYPNTKKWYGTSGNSFLAIVEFGDRVRAKAVSAGGQSGDPKSRHFTDQAGRYAAGHLREVYFYPDQLEGHIERTYHPGE